MHDTPRTPAVVEVNEANFDVEVEQADIPVFVDFWAPWCGPCKALAPLFEKLAGIYGGQIKFAKVNTDENQALAERMNVRGLPTLLLFRDGRVVETTSGAQSKSHFSNLLDRYVTAPVTVPAPATPPRSFCAFHGDAALRDAVVERVRGHINAERILSSGSNGPLSDPEHQRYSLMAAALESTDIPRYEDTLGIPAEAARVAELVHGVSMREVDVDGQPQYHLRGVSRLYPVEWLLAIPLGADLGTLVPRFIHWYLADIVSVPFLYQANPSPEARAVVERIAFLHLRQANGDPPTAEQWKEARAATGEALPRARSSGEKPDLFSHLVMTTAEMLAWPAGELDDAMAGAIGTMFYALWQQALSLAYPAEQWAYRLAVLKAAQDRQAASPDATPEQMEAFEEIKAFRTLMQECQARDNIAGLEAKYAFGERLHTGLMQVLAETVEVKA